MMNFINNHPLVFSIIITFIVFGIAELYAFEVPSSIIRKITIFYREQKLFTLFPKRYGLLFCWCYPIKEVKELPNLGDYICVNKYSNKGYDLHTWGSFEYKHITWEEVKELASNNK